MAMEADWERTASNNLKRYGYVVISCANFASSAGYSHTRTIYPHFIHLAAVGHRPVASNKVELRQRRGVGMRVLGTLDLVLDEVDEDITGDRCKIIPRYSHAGHCLDILVICGWWEANRFLPDEHQKMESDGLLRYMFLSENLFISEYSINPRTNSYQEVQLGIVAGRLLYEDYPLGTQWFNHDDGEFQPQDFLLLKAQRGGYRGVLAVPVISSLEGNERVMPPDVSRFVVTSADRADKVTTLNAAA